MALEAWLESDLNFLHENFIGGATESYQEALSGLPLFLWPVDWVQVLLLINFSSCYLEYYYKEKLLFINYQYLVIQKSLER